MVILLCPCHLSGKILRSVKQLIWSGKIRGNLPVIWTHFFKKNQQKTRKNRNRRTVCVVYFVFFYSFYFNMLQDQFVGVSWGPPIFLFRLVWNETKIHITRHHSYLSFPVSPRDFFTEQKPENQPVRQLNNQTAGQVVGQADGQADG